MQIPQAVDKLLVGLLLQGVDPHDLFMQMLGVFEVRKLLHHSLGPLATLDDEVPHHQGIRADGLDVVAVDPQQNIFNLVHHLVNVLAQEKDVLPLNGGDKGLGQHIEQLVLLLVCSMLQFVHGIQFFF